MKLGVVAVAVVLTMIIAPGVVVAGPVQPVAVIPPIDGSNHNLADPGANQAGTALKRFLPDAYSLYRLGHIAASPRAAAL